MKGFCETTGPCKSQIRHDLQKGRPPCRASPGLLNTFPIQRLQFNSHLFAQYRSKLIDYLALYLILVQAREFKIPEWVAGAEDI